MQYLKHMHTDHSCIQNSDIETKHLSFENHFPDQNQIQLEITNSTRQTHSIEKCFGKLDNYIYTLIQSTV